MKPLRAAVIGVGHLGKFHAQKYAALPDTDLVAVIDTNATQAEQIAAVVCGVDEVADLAGEGDLLDL